MNSRTIRNRCFENPSVNIREKFKNHRDDADLSVRRFFQRTQGRLSTPVATLLGYKD